MEEGDLITQSLTDPSIKLTEIPDRLIKGDRATRDRVRTALRSGRYDVVHYAGHAFFDAAHPGKGGLGCNGGEILNGSDLDGAGASLPHVVVFNHVSRGEHG